MTPNPPEDEARALWVAIIVECPECPDAVGAMDAFRDFWEAESHVNDRTDQLPSTKWEIFEAVEYTKSGQSVGYKRGYQRALEEVEKFMEEGSANQFWTLRDFISGPLRGFLKAKGGV